MQEIAEALKKQREAQGLTLDDLFQRTRINPEFLQALETGQFDVLPDTYVKLFIKKYAQEVGCNVDEILSLYDRKAPRKEPPPPKPQPSHHKQNFKPVILIAIVVIIAGLLIWQVRQQGEQGTAAPLDATVPVATKPQQAPRQPIENTAVTVLPKATTPSPNNDTFISTTPDTTTAQSAEELITEDIAEPNQTQSPTTDLPQQTEQSIQELPSEEQVTQAQVTQPLPTQTEQPAPSDQAQQSQQAVLPETESEPSNENTLTPETPVERLTDSTPAETVLSNPIYLPLPVSIAPENPIILSGIAQQATQILVKADGRILFDGPLQAGSRPRWIARDSFDVILSNQNAMALSLQNQPLQIDTPPNQAIQVNINRTQLRIVPITP